jgi:hypothetical protein
MKTKFFIGLSILSLIGISLLYACKKEATKLDQTSIVQNEKVSSLNYGRIEEEILYSIDDSTGVKYKMRINRLADGSVEIERSIYEGTEIINGTSVGIEDDIEYTMNTNEDSLKISISDLDTMYFIPFMIDEPINVLSGGYNFYYCQSGCNNWSLTCKEVRKKKSNDHVLWLYCEGTCTYSCGRKAVWCPGEGKGNHLDLTKPAGSVLIRAKSVNIIN